MDCGDKLSSRIYVKFDDRVTGLLTTRKTRISIYLGNIAGSLELLEGNIKSF